MVVKKLGLELSDVRAEEFLKNSVSEVELSSSRTQAAVAHLSSGPVVVLVVARTAAVSVLKQLVRDYAIL